MAHVFLFMMAIVSSSLKCDHYCLLSCNMFGSKLYPVQNDHKLVISTLALAFFCITEKVIILYKNWSGFYFHDCECVVLMGTF